MGKRKTRKPAAAREKYPAKPRWKLWAVAAGVLVVLGGGITYWAFTSKAGASVGRTAPNFTLDLLKGGSLNLSSLRGKAVVLNFWASG